jgi:cell division protein ZapA
MAQMTIRINGYAYVVGCEDGQEAHLTAMATEIESRVNSIKALGGQSGESRLLVLAALLMADELHDLKLEAAQLRTARPAPAGADATKPAGDAALRRRLAKLAERAEAIAGQLAAE